MREQVFCVPQIMPGVWLVLSKVTFLVTGLLQRGHGEGVPVSATEGDLPDPGIEPGYPALQADSLLSEPPGKSECEHEHCSVVSSSLQVHG